MFKVPFMIVLLFWSVNKAQLKEQHHDTHSHDWDLLIFTQQWPETVCKDWVHQNPSHTCVMPKKQDSWSIHGIWPTKLGTMGPEFCNRTWHLDPEEIRPIETDLINIWTNIEGGTGEYSLWEHEWSKHGTCAAILPPLNSPLNYFSMGLQLFKKYDMSAILARSGIVPDDDVNYQFIDIQNAVRNVLKVKPAVRCRSEQGQTYLSEIRICFDKKLSLCNCDHKSEQKLLLSNSILTDTTSCDHAQGILYPHNKNPPKTIYLQLYKLITWVQWLTL